MVEQVIRRQAGPTWMPTRHICGLGAGPTVQDLMVLTGNLYHFPPLDALGETSLGNGRVDQKSIVWSPPFSSFVGFIAHNVLYVPRTQTASISTVGE
jgi:hypothetical protein